MEHFISDSCQGEICGPCYRTGKLTTPATHKLGEEIPHDHPRKLRHNLTMYVCCKCFALIVGPKSAQIWAGCKIEE